MQNRPYSRAERVADQIQKTLGEIITRNLNFDGINGLITISRVVMTVDLKIAKVYLSYLGNKEKRNNAFKIIHDSKSRIRQWLGQKVHLKNTPIIKFYNDNTFEQISRIEELFQKINKYDKIK